MVYYFWVEIYLHAILKTSFLFELFRIVSHLLIKKRFCTIKMQKYHWVNKMITNLCVQCTPLCRKPPDRWTSWQQYADSRNLFNFDSGDSLHKWLTSVYSRVLCWAVQENLFVQAVRSYLPIHLDGNSNQTLLYLPICRWLCRETSRRRLCQFALTRLSQQPNLPLKITLKFALKLPLKLALTVLSSTSPALKMISLRMVAPGTRNISFVARFSYLHNDWTKEPTLTLTLTLFLHNNWAKEPTLSYDLNSGLGCSRRSRRTTTSVATSLSPLISFSTTRFHK